MFKSLLRKGKSIALRAGYSPISRVFDPRRSAVPVKLQRSIQSGIMKMSYRGSGFFKSPFDVSLYLKLVQELQPKLIIEIGSAEGGSAKWFADLVKAINLDCEVHSFDITPPALDVSSPLFFHSGDIHQLEDTCLGELLESNSGPVLVSEDGPHTYEGCLAALSYFASRLRSGDYIVIEDGNLRDLGFWDLKNGPNRAIKHFLRNNQGIYEEDRELTGFFGPNVTWNTNGWLRKA